jgi:hypothetical protein
MAKKIAYRVRNWKGYNPSVINRGNLTIWFSEDAIKSWYQKPQEKKKRDRACLYSDAYIELALTIRTLCRNAEFLILKELDLEFLSRSEHACELSKSLITVSKYDIKKSDEK